MLGSGQPRQPRGTAGGAGGSAPQADGGFGTALPAGFPTSTPHIFCPRDGAACWGKLGTGLGHVTGIFDVTS